MALSKEEVLERNRARYAADPEKFRTKRRAYHARNKDKEAAYGKKYKAENKEKMTFLYRRHHLKANYNMTLEQFQAMLDQQNGQCRICEKDFVFYGWGSLRVVVDHDHDTGEIRGLLCSKCNKGLGHFEDDPKLLQKAIAHLTQSRLKLVVSK